MENIHERRYKVYIHTTPSNKRYIGITHYDNPNQRWQNGRGYKHNNHFWNAIKCYGWDNIKHEIVAEDLSEEEAMVLEKQLIAEYNTMNTEYGYNCTSGGEIGKEYTEEVKQKIREKMLNLSDETRQKMSDSAKARCTEEWREKQSKIRKGKYSGNNNSNYENHVIAGANNIRAVRVIRLSDMKIYGYIQEAADDNDMCRDTMRKHCIQHNEFMFYDEYCNPSTYKPCIVKPTTRDMSGNNNPNYGGKYAQRGGNNKRARAVVQLTKNNEFVAYYDCAKDAANTIGAPTQFNIISCCTGNLKSAYGFIWMYRENYDPNNKI